MQRVHDLVFVPHDKLDEYLSKLKADGTTAVVLNADSENAVVAIAYAEIDGAVEVSNALPFVVDVPKVDDPASDQKQEG